MDNSQVCQELLKYKNRNQTKISKVKNFIQFEIITCTVLPFYIITNHAVLTRVLLYIFYYYYFFFKHGACYIATVSKPHILGLSNHLFPILIFLHPIQLFCFILNSRLACFKSWLQQPKKLVFETKLTLSLFFSIANPKHWSVRGLKFQQ